MTRRAAALLAATAATVVALAACGGEPMPQDPVARGKRLYALNCTICHNADPSQPGVVGPEIAGASPELLAARVLRAQYPPGYQPKRSTTVMPAMPQLQPQPGRPSPIEDLAAYLQQAAPSAPHKR